MGKATTLLPLLAVALATQSLAADLVNCDMARVVTQDVHLEECLAPVIINRIDGEIRALPARGFLLEPGIHTVNGRVTLDTTKCHSAWGNVQLGSSPGLEVNFEAGRTYHLAYDHESVSTDGWRLIIWKVDQPCSLYQACLPASEAPADTPAQ